MLIRKIVFPVLTAAIMAGCHTPSMFTSKSEADKNGVQRMMTLANKLESQGQNQVAMRLYQEILAKQPSYTPASESYARLKERTSQANPYAQNTMLASQSASRESIEALVAAEVAKQMAKNKAAAEGSTSPSAPFPSDAMLTANDRIKTVTPAVVSNTDPVALQMMGLSVETVQQRVEQAPLAHEPNEQSVAAAAPAVTSPAPEQSHPFGDPAFACDDNCQTPATPEQVAAMSTHADPFAVEEPVASPEPVQELFADEAFVAQTPAAPQTPASPADAAFGMAENVSSTPAEMAQAPLESPADPFAAANAFDQPTVSSANEMTLPVSPEPEFEQAFAAQPEAPSEIPVLEVAPITEESLLAQLADSDEARQIDALVKLAEMGSNTDIVLERIGDTAFDGSDVVQVHAAWALGQITKQPQISAEDIADFLTSEQLSAVQSAAYLLGLHGEHAQPFLTDLEAELNHDDELTRLHVAEAIVKLSPAHPQAVATILDLASSDDDSIRCLATHVLSEIDPGQHPQTLVSLSMKLNDTDPTIRTAAALALGGYGLKAEPVIPALLLSTSDSDNEVRLAANTALSCIMDEVTQN